MPFGRLPPQLRLPDAESSSSDEGELGIEGMTDGVKNIVMEDGKMEEMVGNEKKEASSDENGMPTPDTFGTPEGELQTLSPGMAAKVKNCKPDRVTT